MRKYCLHPGYIRSKNDGEEHFISAEDLSRLYRIPIADCDVVIAGNPETLAGRRDNGQIHLYPSYSGNYELPKEAT